MKKMLTFILTALIAAGSLFSVNRFTDNGDGTVNDNATGLVWQKCSKGQSGSSCTGTAGSEMWAAALPYCEGLSLGGRSDWRLPNINELKSIVNYKKFGPAINTSFFPNSASSNYWSSSTFVPSKHNVWAVNFENGGMLGTGKDQVHHIRCVSGP